jgi:hypothetical protein
VQVVTNVFVPSMMLSRWNETAFEVKRCTLLSEDDGGVVKAKERSATGEVRTL